MRLASVVSLGVLGAAAAVAPVAAEPALATAELRLGYGLATGGGAGRASLRGSPLVIAAGGSIAINDQPRAAGYANLVIETLDRTGAGGEVGVMLTPSDAYRLRAGGLAIARPYTLWGGTLGASRCFGGATRTCGDLSADVFIGGTDLPAKTAVVQLMFGLGVVIDVR